MSKLQMNETHDVVWIIFYLEISFTLLAVTQELNLSVIYIVQNIFHQGKETRNISLNAHYIVLFKSPRDKQQVSILARQVNPGRVQEFMKSYEEATSRPHGYLMLDLKPTTDDHQRLKSNVLPGENAAFTEYFKKKSYRHPPIVNAMYNSEQQMQHIMQAPQLTPDEKVKMYDQSLQRFLAFQNQLQNQLHFKIDNIHNQLQNFQTPRNLPDTAYQLTSNTPVPNLLTPPPTNSQPRSKPLKKWITGDSDADESDSDRGEVSDEIEDDMDRSDLDEDADERDDMDRRDLDENTDADENDLDGSDFDEEEDSNVIHLRQRGDNKFYKVRIPSCYQRSKDQTFKIKTPRYSLRARPY